MDTAGEDRLRCAKSSKLCSHPLCLRLCTSLNKHTLESKLIKLDPCLPNLSNMMCLQQTACSSLWFEKAWRHVHLSHNERV